MIELLTGPAGEIPQSDTIHTLFFSTASTGTFTVPAVAQSAGTCTVKIGRVGIYTVS